MGKKWLFLLLKLLGTGLLLYFLSQKIDLELVKDTLTKVNYPLFIFSLIILLARNYLAALRLQILLNVKHFTPPILLLLKDYFIGMFFNFFLPTAVGGDVVRGYYLTQYGIDKMNAASAIIVERILGLICLVFIPFLVLPFYFSKISALVLLAYFGMSLGLLILFVIFFFFPSIFSHPIFALNTFIKKILDSITNFLNNINAFRQHQSAFLKAFCLSFLYQVIAIWGVYLIGLSLNCDIDLAAYFWVLPISWIISMIPISLNGLGLREGAFIVLFSQIGMDNNTALAISILYLLLIIIHALIGALLYLLNSTSYQKSSTT